MYSALSFISAFTFGNLRIQAIHQYSHKLGVGLKPGTGNEEKRNEEMKK